MASGSVLIPTIPSMMSSGDNYAQNMPASVSAMDVDQPNQHTATENANPASNDFVSSSELESQPNTPSPNHKPNGLTSPTSDEPEDEGSPDTTSNADTPLQDDQESSDHASASSAHSSRPGKRKSDVSDEEFIRKDPELYGLRRSGRARNAHAIVDDSEVDNEDSASDVDTRPALKRRKLLTSRKTSKASTPIPPPASLSESESDSYEGHRPRALSKKQHRRLLHDDSSAASPAHGEIRFSTRRAAKIATYNEDESEDEFAADDQDAGTPDLGNTEDDSPFVEKILNHRPKNDSVETYTGIDDFEYHIKWNGKSHYHSTWELWSSLSSLRGFRKVKNYFHGVVEREMLMNDDPNYSLDDKEKYLLEREAMVAAFEENIQIERVIDKQDGDDGTEYLVKWKGLYYDNCTWETTELIGKLAQTEIDRYLDRVSKLPILNKTESNPRTRSPYKAFRDQPDYVKNGELREFQIKGVNFLAHNWCKGNSVILADEMGLGKTVQTVSFISWLHHERQQQGPFIVVVPLSTMPAWADTFNYWAPDINYVVYTGNDAARSVIREKELFIDGNPRRTKFNVLLTTYDYFNQKGAWTWDLAQVNWQFLAVDEAHRLKNRASNLYGKLMELNAPSRLLITGTPVQNNLGELSALMHFLMPGKIVVDDNIDLQSDAASQKLTELTEQISPYIIRRTKRSVEKDLPAKTEKIIRVELSDFQLEYYKNILTRNYAALNEGGKGQKMGLLNIMMELKKASNHPFMFANAEEKILAGSDRRDDILKYLITSSGKMMLLDQLLTKLKKDGHRVLIFSQMVRMLDIMGDYLQARGHQFQRLDGMIPAPQRRRAIDHFNAPDSKDFCFILSTRAGGLGINLMTADTVILFDSDWNPQADLQAMARAHRIGQKNPVTVYRLVSKDTVEEEVLERARNKLMLEFITIQRGVTDKDANIPKKLKRNVNAPEDADDINRILKRRGQKMFEQSGNQKRLEELDIDAVLENAEEHKTEQLEGLAADGGEDFLRNFEYTDVKVELEWDEIIPKEQLDEIKAEEKRKEEAKYLESVIEQNAPRKRKAAIHDERDQRAAKKRARDLAIAEAAQNDDSSDSDADPKRPLEEREIRNLIRSYERYGSMEERGEELIRDAKLVGRDVDLLKATLADVVAISHQHLKEEQDRLTTLQRNENKIPTKKDKKAVLFDYHGVKRLNAETLIERPMEMRMLRDVMTQSPDYTKFRVAEASKGAQYTCPWGAREDGMLCVGIYRHGYGAWPAIRDDADLGLSDKFFLEEHQVAQKEERNKADKSESKAVRSPGAVHLVRRANYLLSVLKDKTSNGTNIVAKRALENHHRNNKKHTISNSGKYSELSGRPSPSPAPGNMLKHHRDSDLSRQASHDRLSSQLKHSSDRHPLKRQSSENLESDRRKLPRQDQDTRGLERQSLKRRSPDHIEPERRKIPRINSDHKDLDRNKQDRNVAEPNRKARPMHNGSANYPSMTATKPSDTKQIHKHHGDVEKAKLPPSGLANGTSQDDLRMEQLFMPLAKQVQQLKDERKLVKGDPGKQIAILKQAVTSVGRHFSRHVINNSLDENACWAYFAKHHWKFREVTGPELKLIAMKALKQQESDGKNLSNPLAGSSSSNQQSSSKIGDRPNGLH